MSTPNHETKVLYTGQVRTVGDRDAGVSRSDDGRLDVKHTVPGKPGDGTNPEQLLAAGWAACFQGAIGLAAGQMKVALLLMERAHQTCPYSKALVIPVELTLV